ncbi:hypothetical protein [Pelagibius sp.]|uniref:hypothetical protein n=1 Tax=Pelagibius sp. TaxID=1931238 RepID=UPI003B505FB9
MIRGLSAGRLAAPLLCVVAMGLLGACSAMPFQVSGSDEAVESARAESAGLLPRLRPYAFGLCYSPAVNEDSEVDDEAAYICDGGRLVRKNEDVFWNGCSLTQPNRVNFVCFPPDKAKRPTASQPQ